MERYRAFKSAWVAANADTGLSEKSAIGEIDKVMHGERTSRGGVKPTYAAEVCTLPKGAMVDIDGIAYLVWGKHLHQWSFDGYTNSDVPTDSAVMVRVLTPVSIIRMFKNGFVPGVHDSAFRAPAN